MENASKMDDIYCGESGALGHMALKFLSRYITRPVVVLLLTSFAIYMFATQIYYRLPWIFWKHIAIDVCLLLSVPFYFTIFANLFREMRAYSRYEAKHLKYYDLGRTRNEPDLYLEVWEDVKYYPYVKQEDIWTIHCTEGFRSCHPRGKSLEVPAAQRN